MSKLEFRIHNSHDIWWQDQDLHFIDEHNTKHILTNAYLAGRKVEFEGNAIKLIGDVAFEPAQLTYEAFEYEAKPVKTEINITRLGHMSLENELRKLAGEEASDARDVLRKAANEIEWLTREKNVLVSTAKKAGHKIRELQLENERLKKLEGVNEQVAQLKKDLDAALVALRKIYEYRSDKPDWNMVMAIAGDVVEPMVAVVSGRVTP